MPDQPEPSTVESGPVTLTPVPTEQDSGDSGDQTSGDDDFVSLEELKKMSLEDLTQFISDNNLTAPVEAQTNPSDLLDWLLAEYGVDV